MGGMGISENDLRITALILAGGRSSRMGQDKALLPMQGVFLIEQIYRVAAAVSSPVAIVSPWPERYQPLLPESCRFVREPLPAEGEKPPGPLVGFLRGLDWIASEAGHEPKEFPAWVLLLACDLPRLDEATLRRGVAQLETLPPQVLALVPRSEQGWEPLCGFYRGSCREELQRAVAEGDRSFQRWLEKIPVQIWDLADPGIMFNCNTPEDWAQI